MVKNKSIRYLFRTENMPDHEIEEIKETYVKKGIRVVVLTEGRKDIHDGLKRILLNHE